jgi:hypothetical protein
VKKITASYEKCRLLQKADGYGYTLRPSFQKEKMAIAPQAKALGFTG